MRMKRMFQIAAVCGLALGVTPVVQAQNCGPADLNGDGVIDADDFFLFLSLFASGDPRADINGDGVIDADDFFDYLGLFAAGCVPTDPQPPYIINISGATLQEAFFRAPASTNDFIDVNKNGVSTPSVENLAPFATCATGFPADKWWAVSYQSVGSVNGFIDLVNWGQVPAIGDATGPEMNTAERQLMYWDGELVWANPTIINNAYNPANPGGLPARAELSDSTGFGLRIDCDNQPGGGILIDIAPLDTPSSWAVRNDAGDPNPNAAPNSPGYGTNPRPALNPDGTPTAQTNGLPTLEPLPLAASRGAVPLNFNNPPDVNTIVDTSIALAPVAFITNLGTGYEQMTYTEVRHLFATGRMLNGENLVAVTRDIGSGTRNAVMNGICLDPSFGIGDNIGDQVSSSEADLLGPNWQPTNKGGSSRVDGTVRRHRLAVGYSGAERGDSNGWLVNGQLEILALQNDINGGTVFARPTFDNIVQFDENSYSVIGPAVLAHIGDPRAEPVADGGDNNGNPPMFNKAAADYLNNITRSIENFVDVPNAPANTFSPAEFLVSNFLLTAAARNISAPSQPCVYIPNPAYNQNVEDASRLLSVLNFPEYQSFGVATRLGQNPRRTSGFVYSDGVANGANYINQNGDPVAYDQPLDMRNRIAGDFNGDGVRDLDDAQEMVAAWRQRNGGPAWNAPAYTGDTASGDLDTRAGNTAGGFAVIEILGDFNGDGSFTDEDIRYWADGLALDPTTGMLDRFEGFRRIDMASETLGTPRGNNFFGTTLATGGQYQPGFSAADIAGATGTTPGFKPSGADGVIDIEDILYVYDNFGDWFDLIDAINMDLSADMNGDMVVDIKDVCFIIRTVLGTDFGDFNLDGNRTAADRAIIAANLGQPGGYLDGDLDGDGMVTQNDLDIFDGLVDPCN